MLESIKSYIKELPKEDFNEYYQKYILNVQDDNLSLKTQFNGTTFISINKLITAIHRELGNIS